ncbi:uncharacterized protein LOC124814398 [Hydra vulgaris]|uniref:uncharacterized protein LOC124814398 n=1 Tax=Hydra vulgaris TaxID=6087 RepID=UPI001F5E5790|nr:uncharacterized protein LOC124814398 isoform X1 [Hydra vulgaris]XP_047138013.1 uncharacterized protein LOC124814398 isoform X1 [Hydra vulgaris]XP_047138014.1 uncharacterized protein LOC124814398 isoform X1 [Hydra vulgaris]
MEYQRKSVLKKRLKSKLKALLTIVCVIVFLYMEICMKNVNTTDNQTSLIPIILNYSDPFQYSHNYTTQQVRNLKIVIPFHIKKIKSVFDNISKWKIFRPCDQTNSSSNNVELIFYVGYFNEGHRIMKKISLISNQTLECFANKYVVFYKYNNIDDYLNAKSSRLMFESMLNKSNEHFNHLGFVFYMEPDVRPIKSNWLNALFSEIGNGNFWVKGSTFRGDIKQFMKNDLYAPDYFHINCNALYNIGSDNFRHFYFKILRPYVVKMNGNSKNAYDTNFFEFFFDRNNYQTMRDVIHQFRLSDFIQNYWKTKYKVDELSKKYANTYFVHGGFPSY